MLCFIFINMLCFLFIVTSSTVVMQSTTVGTTIGIIFFNFKYIFHFLENLNNFFYVLRRCKIDVLQNFLLNLSEFRVETGQLRPFQTRPPPSRPHL